MHRDTLRNANADGGDLASRSSTIGADPNTATAVDALTVDAKVNAHVDEQLFDPAHEGNYVEWFAKAHDGVADELSRPMPGDLPSAINVNDRSIRRQRPGSLMGFGTSAGRIDGGVLQEQEVIRRTADHLSMNAPLQVPALVVVDESSTQFFDDQP